VTPDGLGDVPDVPHEEGQLPPAERLPSRPWTNSTSSPNRRRCRCTSPPAPTVDRTGVTTEAPRLTSVGEVAGRSSTGITRRQPQADEPTGSATRPAGTSNPHTAATPGLDQARGDHTGERPAPGCSTPPSSRWRSGRPRSPTTAWEAHDEIGQPGCLPDGWTTAVAWRTYPAQVMRGRHPRPATPTAPAGAITRALSVTVVATRDACRRDACKKGSLGRGVRAAGRRLDRVRSG
jgi:hypothetical protein